MFILWVGFSLILGCVADRPLSESVACPGESESGLFAGPSDRSGCSPTFIACLPNGRGFITDCPEGLAWSQETERCEWPDEVKGCDPSAFLGLRCPGARSEGDPDFGDHTRHSIPGDCNKFYVCIEGATPRLLGCGEEKAFNPETNSCDKAANVRGCAG